MKSLKTLFTLFSAICLLSVTVCTAASPVLTGDANGDGTVNLLDLVHTKKYIADNSFEIVNIDAVDTDCDGVINAIELASLRNILLEKEKAELICNVESLEN